MASEYVVVPKRQYERENQTIKNTQTKDTGVQTENEKIEEKEKFILQRTVSVNEDYPETREQYKTTETQRLVPKTKKRRFEMRQSSGPSGF